MLANARWMMKIIDSMLAIVMLLSAMGCQFNQPKDLKEATLNGDISAVKHYLFGGAAVNAEALREALILAVEFNRKEVVQVLLSRIDAKTNDGGTAMMIASQKGYKEVAQLLIDNGANVNSKMNNGATALAVSSSKDVKDLLIKSGAE